MSNAIPARPTPPDPNLRPTGFPEALDWSRDKQQESLDKLHRFVVGECGASIDWYYRKKWSKSLLGFLLRLGAILMVGVGGLIPLIGELLKRNGIPGISPAWATVALALAALLIAIDRFGGYTSGWIRYIRTAQTLTRLKGEFLMDWQEHRRALCGEPTDSDRTKEGILLCKQFLCRVYEQVRLETDLWAEDFQQALQTVNSQSEGPSRGNGSGGSSLP